MMRAFWNALALAIAAGVSGMAHAYEFIAKPETMTVQAGAELNITGVSTRVFRMSQELEAPKDAKVGSHSGGKRTDIAVKPDEKNLAYEGIMTAPFERHLHRHMGALPLQTRTR